MYMVVLNHQATLDDGDTMEMAVVVDGDMPGSFGLCLEDVSGFLAVPWAARLIANKSPSSSRHPSGTKDIKARMGADRVAKLFASSRRRKFTIPFNSIAYIEDLGEMGEKND